MVTQLVSRSQALRQVCSTEDAQKQRHLGHLQQGEPPNNTESALLCGRESFATMFQPAILLGDAAQV